MIATIRSVVRGEGLGSALRRAQQRSGESLRHLALLTRGYLSRSRSTAPPAVLNISASPLSHRLGGVPTQLDWRLREERRLRDVSLMVPGTLERHSRSSKARRIPRFLPTRMLRDEHFEAAVRHSLALTGATAIHLEGISGIPLQSVRQLIAEGVDVVVSVHDFALFSARPNLLEQPWERFCDYSTDLQRCERCLRQTWAMDASDQAARRQAARALLEEARRLIFPSAFLLAQHRLLFDLPLRDATVIEPGVPWTQPPELPPRATRRTIAFAGSVMPHKGAGLLLELVRRGGGDLRWHIFGGGDEQVLRDLRAEKNVTVHGFYRTSLADLLRGQHIDLVVLPSIVPESFSLTLSEAWMAGIPAIAFQLGALQERIEQTGGGWTVPLGEGVDGITQRIEQWKDGRLSATVPKSVSLSRHSAERHLSLYRELFPVTFVGKNAAR